MRVYLLTSVYFDHQVTLDTALEQGLVFATLDAAKLHANEAFPPVDDWKDLDWEEEGPPEIFGPGLGEAYRRWNAKDTVNNALFRIREVELLPMTDETKMVVRRS